MKIIFFILISVVSIVAQNLLPLQLGNKWIYEDADQHLYEVKIDTVVNINGVEYYNCSKSNKIPNLLYRLRNDGYYVDRTKSDTTEWEYYWENADIGDIWYYPPDPNIEGFIPSVEVRDTVTTKIFGKYVKIKILYYDGGLIARYRYYTDEFGMLLDSIVPFDDVVARLKGCVINGIAYGDTSLVSGIEEKKITLNTDYILNQNYPNPFNPTTNIKFSIVDAGRYMLKVYNILGQEVATLMNDQLNPGNHIVTFDASKLASGIYIYQLSGNNINLVKKMLLMK